MKAQQAFMFFVAGTSLLLGGCYQPCIPNGAAGNAGAPGSADMVSDDLNRSPLTTPGNAGYTRGEVWTVTHPLDATAGNGASPWTTVVYAQSAFVLPSDESLQGKLTLHIASDGTVSVSTPGASSASASPSERTPFIHRVRENKSNAGMIGDDKAGFGWLKRFSGRGDIPCLNAALRRDAGKTDTVLELDYMLAHGTQPATAAFGVRVSANGRRLHHSEIIRKVGNIFIADFDDSTHAAARTVGTGGADLNVFRIHITAEPTDAYDAHNDHLRGRLLDATFSPKSHMLYVVSIGMVLRDPQGSTPLPKTGALEINPL
jgi:hypothetical protein